MSWLLFVVVAVIFDSLRIFIDNYVSDVYFKGKQAAAQKVFFGYFFTVVSILMFIIFGLDSEVVTPAAFALLILSGLLNSLAGIPYYRALEVDDSTNVGIFVQLSPVLYLIFGWFLLGESFSPLQLVAFFIVLAAPLLIVFTTRKRSRHIRFRAMLYALLYVVIDVIGNIIFVKETSLGINFINGLSLVFLGKGLGNLLIIYCIPKWRRRYNFVKKESKGKLFRPLLCDGLASLVKDFSYRGALVAAPAVALASAASDSFEPLVIFFMGIILTLIWPKFGREKLDRKTVVVHLFATVLAITGIVLMQF